MAYSTEIIRIVGKLWNTLVPLTWGDTGPLYEALGDVWDSGTASLIYMGNRLSRRGSHTAGPKLTARQAACQLPPVFESRLSPRKPSSSKTSGTRRRTFSDIRPWENFDAELQDLIMRLDDIHRKYKPVLIPEPDDDPSFENLGAPGDERAVYVPIVNLFKTVNGLLRDLDIKAKYVSGGSNRSFGFPDFAIRTSDTPPQRFSIQMYNIGTGECKGEWQWVLPRGVRLEDAPRDPNLQKDIIQGLQQAYGDAVIEAVAVFIITNYDTTVILRRQQDPVQKVLEASPPIYHNDQRRPLIASLVLAGVHAATTSAWKEDLNPALVPLTPEQGYRILCSSETKGRDRSSHMSYDLRPGRSQRFICLNAKKSNGFVTEAAAHEDSGAANWAAAGSVVEGQASGAEERLAAPATSIAEEFAAGSSEAENVLSVVSLSRLCLRGGIHEGPHGHTLQAVYDGNPAYAKLFNEKNPAAAAAFLLERRVYARLDHLADSPVAKVMAIGELAHAGYPVMVLADAGDPLSESGLISEELCSAALVALKRIHDLGIVHNDLRLSNILQRDGHITLIDFGNAILEPEPEQKMAEFARLEVLLGVA